MKNKDLYSAVKVFSNCETAALIVSGEAESSRGAQRVADEVDLTFIKLSCEALDIAMRRGVCFRKLFHKFLEHLYAPEILKQAKQTGDYDFGETGKLICGGVN